MSSQQRDDRPPGGRPEARSRLRFEVLNAFVDTGMADLSRAELAVWLILYRDTKPGGTARASLDDLARRAGSIGKRHRGRSADWQAGRCSRCSGAGGLNRGPSTYRVFPFPMEYDALRTVGADAYSTVGISLPAL